MRRLSYVQRRVLEELRQSSQQSYEDLAAAVEADRSSIIIAVKILERRRRVVKVRGRGPQPNRYVLTDKLIIW